MRFQIVTLGCPKNEVDSEGIEALLTEAGHSPAERCEEADLVILNTCGFIDAATEESVAALRRLADRKRPGSYLVAAGCLAQREGATLLDRVHGIDAVMGCRNWTQITQLVSDLSDRSDASDPSIGPTTSLVASHHSPFPPLVYLDGDLQLTSIPRKARPGSAYVKISDGCDASCAFCAIPSIKGSYRSKPREAVLTEVRQLADGGTKEVILVGQDSTAYGLDLGYRDGLAGLLRSIAEQVPSLPWIRVMYLYPQRMTPELLRTMAELPQVCKYVDIPLQHTHPAVLERMRRPKGDVRGLIEKLREAIPSVAIRTTFIVGFPGETAAEHHHLLRSIEELKLDRVGAFAYSPQSGTPAASMDGQVPDHLKQKRWRQTMEVAQKASLKVNRKLVGRELDVLVEGTEEAADGKAGMIAGRSYRDAPEVDGLVFFSGKADVGQIVRVRITDAMEYDLVGHLVGGQGTEDRGRGARRAR